MRPWEDEEERASKGAREPPFGPSYPPWKSLPEFPYHFSLDLHDKAQCEITALLAYSLVDGCHHDQGLPSV
jgi:hypothetical protein